MSRLYWSNLPDANRPRGGTSALCSSFTTEDFADAGIAGGLIRTAWIRGSQHVEGGEQRVDLAFAAVQFPGIISRSDASCAASENGSMQPCDFHCARHCRRSTSTRRRSDSAPRHSWTAASLRWHESLDPAIVAIPLIGRCRLTWQCDSAPIPVGRLRETRQHPGQHS